MVFTLLVAADVAGDKQNLELGFPTHPTLTELEAAIKAAYQQEFPGHVFNLSRMQFYDEGIMKWVDLVSASHLRDFLQIYAFNRGAVEVQKPIPAPRKPVHQLTSAMSNMSIGGRRSPEPVTSMPVQSVILPDNATHDEKVQAVFDELDINNNRVIEPEEFRRAFRVHSFDFSAATVTDLFSKSDSNHDGVLSYAEFQLFAEMYPTLLDSLYFRIRDYWEDFRQKQSIKTASDNLAATKDEEKRAHMTHIEAQQATTLQEKRLASAEAALADAIEAERQAKERLLAIQRELEATMRERSQKLQDLDIAKERERQRITSHAEAQRETDKAQQDLAWQEAEQAKAQDKERQAANAVLEAQRETERARRLEAEASADLQAARDREQQANLALMEEKRQTELAAERLKQCEMELQLKVQHERELQHRVQEALCEIDIEKQKRDEDERALHSAREQEQAAHMAHLEAQRVIEEQEKKMLAIEAERQAAIQRRKQVEEQERPLLEQEVRLREQRESLEEMESRLRKEATAFHSSRATPRVGGRR